MGLDRGKGRIEKIRGGLERKEILSKAATERKGLNRKGKQRTKTEGG